MTDYTQYKKYKKEISSTKYSGLVSEASDRLLEFSQRLLHNNNFTIVKFGDGELRNMTSNNEREHNCDGNFYFSELGTSLIESYIYFLKHGVSYICKWHSHEYEIQNKMEQDHLEFFNPDRKFLYYDILIHKLPIPIEQLQFFKIIKHINRPKVYFTNEELLKVISPVLNVNYAISVPQNNTYLVKNELYNAIDNFMSSLKTENMIIMFSVGMFAKVIIAHMSEKYPNNTYLDIGSSFDGLLNPSRDFMFQKNYVESVKIHYVLNNEQQTNNFKNYEMALINFDKYKQLTKQKILVLGSNGVIGKALTTFLKEQKHEVVEWDIKINSVHDLRIFSLPHLDLHTFDFIYFLAYDIGGSKYLSNQKLNFINNNVLIMNNVFNKIQECNDKYNKKIKFIFASSQMENMNNPYGTLKRLGEHYTELLGGISTRFWNVYGHEELDNKSHVITDFIHKYKTNGSIELMTNGQEERQFLHTEDCARALYTVHKYYDVFAYRKHIDITNGQWTKIYDLALLITKDEAKIKVSDKKDFIQDIKNEPDLFLLYYWRPKIYLQDYITDNLK